MCKYIGGILFLLGSVGLLGQQYLSQQERTRFLQEMNQSLLRLRQSITKRSLPVLLAIRKEQEQCDELLVPYYEKVCEKLQQNESKQVFSIFWEDVTPEMIKMTKEEERRLWVQALCALFLVENPGEDDGFFAYYDGFLDTLKKDYSTKKERQKVTACTTGMGLLMLLLLLL